MSDIDLVVTDLDGTLWWGWNETHLSTVEAWRTLEANGIPVLVATGRRVHSTREPLAALGLTPPAVVMNGALVLDLATDERFHLHDFGAEAASAVLAEFRAAGLEPCVYVEHDDADVFIGDEPSTHALHVAELGTGAQPFDLDTAVATTPVLMFGIMGHPEAPFAELARALDGIAEVHVAPSDQYGGFSCTATPIGLSKWVGVEVYCERHGIDASRVLAIGDGPNDLELLEGAAIAVVPEDGQASALAVADVVVPSTRDGGWAKILDLV